MARSNEANRGQLELARRQGQADSAALDWVLANSGPLKGDTKAGQYRIAFTITPPEGWWDKGGSGELVWHDAEGLDAHLRIFVMDGADGRFVPELSVHATLTDANGNRVTVPSDFGWYPLMNAYGGNIQLPRDGAYTLTVTIDPLQAHRHDPYNGYRFQHTTVAVFPPVNVTVAEFANLPVASDTAAQHEAELMKPAIAALSDTITAMWNQANAGGEKGVADYFVGYAIEYAEAYWQFSGSKFTYKSGVEYSGKENAHVEVSARDSRTGRFIPGLNVRATVIAEDGREFGPQDVHFMWHPWLYHYGQNWRIPGSGTYKLHVQFDAPGFRRWGRESKRFATAVDTTFDNVEMKAGEK